MQNPVSVVPYGKWESAITVEHLSSSTIHLEGVRVNPSTGQVFVLESRPSEDGRFVIVELVGGTARDILPAANNAMGAIHEYGGGSFDIHPTGRLLFTNYPNNGIFLIDPESRDIETIVAPDKSVRFGSFNVHPTTEEWILAIQETHVQGSSYSADVINTIVAINMTTGEVSTIVEGADFYQHPQFSPDGERICWTQWNHPDMPWSGTMLYTAYWKAGKLSEHNFVSGQPRVNSICQPRWGMDNSLFYVSDETGYWQLYQFDGTSSKMIHLKGLELAEFGSREPSLGNCTYVQLDHTTLVASATSSATSNLVLIDLKTGSWRDLSLPIVDIQMSALARISASAFCVIGSTRTVPQALYRVDLDEGISIELLKPTSELHVPDSIISLARHITYPRVHSESNTVCPNAHAWLLQPKNNAFKAPEGTKPPLLVWMHGGPTYHVPPGFSLESQYWTSRGYAYALINHVGSTGYGRAYREALDGEWGKADIADAASCVAYLASENLIDSTRVGIVGESAGGYAVLQALYTYPETWAAGISLYGICSLVEFAEATHKFESRYIESLVLGRGRKTKEETQALYKSRSALYHVEKITAPLLILQGDIDTIVPVSQATKMQQKMSAIGKPVDIVIFEGEGHGFQLEKTIKESIQLQTEFWESHLL